MGRETKYYIVSAEALPEIFVKVAEAKRMMQTGECDTVGEATQMVGISRSAFYKYKDAVQPFNDLKTQRIITFYGSLKDAPGVLSSVLGCFAQSGANILTINQSIPVNGCAGVTIAAETSHMVESLETLLDNAEGIEGVVKFEVLAGG
ncbi:ACT domain-containing protein [Bengtsoniella intestinalis]|uniref:ACT domain-containing protein n=1 Tax=Bengtsoniella intestinalis TaxID=3073143 RepID=UPI00391F6259